MARGLDIDVHLDRSQLRSLQRAYSRVPATGQRAMRKASLKLAKDLARLTAAAGRAEGSQAKLGARTVAAVPGAIPRITAGEKGSPRDRAVTLGSEFGATRRFGWYARARFYDSAGRQYKPHRGRASYWFFKTVDEAGPMITQEYVAALDEIAADWGNT